MEIEISRMELEEISNDNNYFIARLALESKRLLA